MIEFIVWRIRLALVSYREKVKAREYQLTFRLQTYDWPRRSIGRFVDRVSPFSSLVGYRRRRLRAVLWRLFHPRSWLRLTSLRWSLVVLDRISPYIGPGRFETMNAATALKVEWLDAHTEEADGYHGDLSVTPLVGHLFTDQWVPWSREDEHWLVTCDDRGARFGFQFTTAEAARRDFESFEDVWPDEREGEPEFNGAFR